MLSRCLILCVILYTAESSFRDVECPSDGYFPALDTCSAYNICLRGIPTKMTCGKLQVYNPETKSCVKKRGTHKCFNFKCNVLTKQYSVYPGDTSLYAICFKLKAIALQKCFNGLFFDEIKGTCTFQCQREGLVPDPYECTKFRECTQFGSKFKWVQKTCPKGSWFNPVYNACSLENTENCFSSSTTSTTSSHGTSTMSSSTEATSVSSPDSSHSTDETSQASPSSQSSTSSETSPTLHTSTSSDLLTTPYPSEKTSPVTTYPSSTLSTSKTSTFHSTIVHSTNAPSSVTTHTTPSPTLTTISGHSTTNPEPTLLTTTTIDYVTPVTVPWVHLLL